MAVAATLCPESYAEDRRPYPNVTSRELEITRARRASRLLFNQNVLAAAVDNQAAMVRSEHAAYSPWCHFSSLTVPEIQQPARQHLHGPPIGKQRLRLALEVQSWAKSSKDIASSSFKVFPR